MIRSFMLSLRQLKASTLRTILFTTLIAGAFGFLFSPVLMPPETVVVPTHNSFSFQVPLSKVKFSDHSFKGRSGFETRTGILTKEDLEDAKTKLIKKMISDLLGSQKKDSAVTGVLDGSLLAHFQDSEPQRQTATKTFELGLQGALTLGNIDKKDIPIENTQLLEEILRDYQGTFLVSGDIVTAVLTSASE